MAPHKPAPDPTTDRFITYDAEGDIILNTPWRKSFVNELRDLVDYDDRVWNKEAKTWTIERAYEKPLRDLLRRHWPAAPPHRADQPPDWEWSSTYARTYQAPDAPPRRPNFNEAFESVQKAKRDIEATLKGAASMPTAAADAALAYGRMEIELAAAKDRITALEASHKRLKVAVREAELARDTARSEANRLRWQEQANYTTRGGSFQWPGGSGGWTASNDPYTVLGVTRDAEPEAVDGAWKALLKKHHPDMGGSTERTQRINNAKDAIDRDLAARRR